MSCNNDFENIPKEEEEDLATAEIVKREIGESCFEAGFVNDQSTNTQECFFDFKTINVSFPQYPGCTFVLDVIYTECNLYSGGSIIYLESFTMLSHDCTDYNDDVEQAEQNGTLEQFSIQFNGMLFDAVSDNLGQSAISSGGFTPYVIKFHTASCIKFCYQLVNRGGIPQLIVSNLQCGTGCCAIEKTYYEINGVLQSWTIDITDTYEGLDECNITVSLNCIRGRYGTDCTFACDSYL